MYDNQLYVEGRNVLFNGKPLPPLPKPAKNIVQIEGHVFINGYEFKYGKWRRTLRAIWHLLF